MTFWKNWGRREGVTWSERPFFICLNIISRCPRWSPHVLFESSVCSFYCLVHCTFHHGSSVVCKSSGPSSCLENEVQTFPVTSRPCIFCLRLVFPVNSLTPFLGWELSLPNQPMTPPGSGWKCLLFPAPIPTPILPIQPSSWFLADFLWLYKSQEFSSSTQFCSNL